MYLLGYLEQTVRPMMLPQERSQFILVLIEPFWDAVPLKCEAKFWLIDRNSRRYTSRYALKYIQLLGFHEFVRIRQENSDLHNLTKGIF